MVSVIDYLLPFFLPKSRCAVSGSGKIAMHVLEKLIAYGALPISVSGKFQFCWEANSL